MTISIEFAEDADLQARIKVVGVGGGGGNAINTMIEHGLDGVEFIAANTDTQALAVNLASEKIQLGQGLTRGLGAGANPEMGRKAALEEQQRIAEAVGGADMVFITAGVGGGTGTGAAPIIAQIARDQGALTVAVVTKPFAFEGRRRMANAMAGLEELAEAVDTIISILNEKLLGVADEDMSMLDAFRRADDVLVQATRGISDLIVNAGMINVDFADVKTIMSCTGRALMGTGYARGENRAVEAAKSAVNSPLLDDVSVEGATGILINFTAGPDLKLKEINEAASLIQAAAHEDANIIFGVVTDPDMEDVVKVTVIATGIDMHASTGAGIHAAEHASATHGRQAQSVPAGIRGATQQVMASTVGMSSAPRERRDVIAQPSRPASAPVAQASVAAPARVTRPFGSRSAQDEAVLDIPAYLRRSKV